MLREYSERQMQHKQTEVLKELVLQSFSQMSSWCLGTGLTTPFQQTKMDFPRNKKCNPSAMTEEGHDFLLSLYSGLSLNNNKKTYEFKYFFLTHKKQKFLNIENYHT